MAKNSVRDFSATASSNTDIQSVDVSEGCAASGINNAIRELMADIKDVSAGTVALESPQADSLTVTGDLTVDTKTLKVDAANNRVGVAQSTPDAELHIGDGSGSSDNTRLRITGGTSGLSTIQFGDTASANIGQLQYDHSSNFLAVRVNAAERARFLSSGGLTFNGDTAAANALDDYEEGTFEPTWTSSDGDFTNVGYNGDTGGRYIKIGNLVYAQGCVRGNGTLNKVNINGSANLQIGGLPFTNSSRSNGDNADGVNAVRVPVWPSGDRPSMTLMQAGAAKASLVQQDHNSLSHTIIASDLNSTAMLQFCLMYTTN